MSSISVSSLVLGSLTVEVDGSDSTLALSVLATAPAVLSVELGTPGAQGPAATIAVGTTTTLSPGAAATVVNAGTSSAAVLNFGIPQGVQGVQGIQGNPGNAATISVGSTTTGAAGSSASVANSGTSSAAVLQFTIPRGDKGDTGNTGATGATGSPGTAATATAGTTTTGAPGTSATVVNAGTTSAAIFNFTIPRGDVGATGATGATGPAGPGVPVGGTAGQSLLKVDGTNYNTTWGTPPLATLATSSETVIATVRNATGSTLTAGQVVYINGAIGNRPSVALARADLEATSSGTYGMVSAPIANNSDGTIVIAGFVANLNTNALTDGDLLYLSPTVAGGFTTTKPTAPDNLVYIGVVTRSHPTLGVIQLRISNGFELDELHDVSATTPSNSDLLAFETSTNLWKNKSAATLGLATTSASNAAYLAKASNLSDLANASTARTNLGLGTAAVEPATKLVPAGGTTGQALVKLSNADWDDGWATIGGGGGVDVQTFGSSTTSGTFTWTKPANAKVVEFILIGGGGGGGSGARQATTVTRGGGGGGSAGAFFIGKCKASRLGPTETVTIGAGGAGGAAVTVNTSIGNVGTAGGDTSFAFGGAAGGSGGGNGSSSGGGGGGASKSGLLFNAIISGITAGAGTAGFGNSGINGVSFMLTGTGGGGAAGALASNTTNNTGGNGGSFTPNSTGNTGLRNVSIAGGSGGTLSGVQASAGASQDDYLAGGTGGGGGFYRTGQAGGTGGNGGFPCGGGGGGGASDNGFNSGAGGNGGNGFAVIITYT